MHENWLYAENQGLRHCCKPAKTADISSELTKSNVEIKFGARPVTGRRDNVLDSML